MKNIRDRKCVCVLRLWVGVPAILSTEIGVGKIGSAQRHQLKRLKSILNYHAQIKVTHKSSIFQLYLLKKDLGVVAAQPLNWVQGVSVLEKLRRQVPCQCSLFFSLFEIMPI